EPIVEIGRDDAELRAQLEHIPPQLAEDAHGRLAVARRQGIELQREELDQRRLARAVGAEDGCVLALADRERQGIEHARAAEDDCRVVQFENVHGVAGGGAAVVREPSSRSMSSIAAGSFFTSRNLATISRATFSSSTCSVRNHWSSVISANAF